jgi:S-adenosylmethionine:tRNA ribosyltransferase-isomerase
VKIDEFDFELPPELIAQAPAESRDASRLLVLRRGTSDLRHCEFSELPTLLRAGDCLVVNDSRVIPARVLAENDVMGIDRDGARVIAREQGTIAALLDAHGLPPLPPYIARHAKPAPEDWERYQTVYAAAPGSVAAPTAGLHFTAAMLQALRTAGVEIHAVTLHVGPATFRPVTATTVEAHRLPAERASVPETAARAIDRARAEGRRVIAVGTTTVRTLESVADDAGRVRPFDGAADLTIRPGHRFRVVDALLTNFHLPRSSLLLLVAAFAGRDVVLQAYRHAVAARYRFYSYGDATLIL